MCAAQAIDNFLGPFVILALAFQRPVGRGACAEVAHIADLVGEFDQARPFAGMFCPGNLEAFAHFLLDSLSIGDFKYDVGDLLAEFATQLLP